MWSRAQEAVAAVRREEGTSALALSPRRRMANTNRWVPRRSVRSVRRTSSLPVARHQTPKSRTESGSVLRTTSSSPGLSCSIVTPAQATAIVDGSPSRSRNLAIISPSAPVTTCCTARMALALPGVGQTRDPLPDPRTDPAPPRAGAPVPLDPPLSGLVSVTCWARRRGGCGSSSASSAASSRRDGSRRGVVPARAGLAGTPRLRVASRRALALLLSPILGLPMLYGFWTPDLSWRDLLPLWLGPGLAYAIGLQWRLAGIPGTGSQAPRPARPPAPPGRKSP